MAYFRPDSDEVIELLDGFNVHTENDIPGQIEVDIEGTKMGTKVTFMEMFLIKVFGLCGRCS
jgi:hypothetical protein